MKLNKVRFGAVLLGLVIFAVGVIGALEYSGENLVKDYSAGEIIRGEINVSFNADKGDSVFSSNFEGEIELKELLDANGFVAGEDYECSNSECVEDFVEQQTANELEIEGDSYAGFVVSGETFVELNEISLEITSNVGASCFNQIEVDVLGDGEYVLANQKYTSIDSCFPTKYGCFDRNLASGYSLATIPSSGEYCEKITLPAGPAYKLGAVVKNSTTGDAELKMELYDDNGFLAECALPGLTQETQTRECIVEYASAVQKDYYVCISASEESDYKIRTETSGEKCGTNNFGQTFPIDYEIFAKNMQFGSFEVAINEDEFQSATGVSLSSYVEDYIFSKYNANCGDGCVIPIGFSGQNQEVSFANARINYDIDGAQEIISNDIYEVAREAPEITSEFLDLELSHAEFEIPLDSSDSVFELFLGEESVFETDISISESFDFDVSPKFVAFGQEVEFNVLTGENVTSSAWNFGDGKTANSFGKTATHRYLEEGEFNLEVEVENSQGLTSRRTFTLVVGDAKEFAERRIAEYKTRIGNFEESISEFEEWVKEEIRLRVNIHEINATLSVIEGDFDSALEDEDYQEVVLNLIELKVPEEISISKSGMLPLVVGVEGIETDYIEELSATPVEDESALRGRIAGWMAENANVVVDFEHVSAFYDSESEVLLSKFKLAKRNAPAENAYLIIGYPIGAIKFEKSYGERAIADGTYFSYTGQEINFIFGEEVEIEEIGAYVSPEVSRLGEFEIDLRACNFNNVCEENLGENTNTCRADCKPYGTALVWILVLIFVALVAYIALQEWYKRYYEKHLFKQPEQLYNVINFIYNARRRGLSNYQIKDKLIGTGWTGEQVSYAIKKIDGERTGMFEIPVFKFIENSKVKSEIESRQGGSVDARFIKRRDLE